MEISDLNISPGLGATATIKVTTQIFNVNHVIRAEIRKTGSIIIHSESKPQHPHIMGNGVCLDTNISRSVRILAEKEEYDDAFFMLASGLETIKMNAAYTNRYSHLCQCRVCSKWTLKETSYHCSICYRYYCSDCFSKCECGEAKMDPCPKCTEQVKYTEFNHNKCMYCNIESGNDKTIYRLKLKNGILEILYNHGIRTIAQLEKEINDNKIPGIGTKRLAEIRSATNEFNSQQVNTN